MKSSIINRLLTECSGTRQEQLQYWQELNQWTAMRFNQLNASTEGEWITPIVEEV